MPLSFCFRAKTEYFNVELAPDGTIELIKLVDYDDRIHSLVLFPQSFEVSEALSERTKAYTFVSSELFLNQQEPIPIILVDVTPLSTGAILNFSLYSLSLRPWTTTPNLNLKILHDWSIRIRFLKEPSVRISVDGSHERKVGKREFEEKFIALSKLNSRCFSPILDIFFYGGAREVSVYDNVLALWDFPALKGHHLFKDRSAYIKNASIAKIKAAATPEETLRVGTEMLPYFSYDVEYDQDLAECQIFYKFSCYSKAMEYYRCYNPAPFVHYVRWCFFAWRQKGLGWDRMLEYLTGFSFEELESAYRESRLPFKTRSVLYSETKLDETTTEIDTWEITTT